MDPKREEDFTVGEGVQAFLGKWSQQKMRQRPRSKKMQPEETKMDDTEATLLLQSYWRMFCYRSKYRKHVKRSNPARELLSTEMTYVRILDYMVNLFLRPIRENELMTEMEIRAVFSNVESILMLNTTLLDETKERMENWDMEQRIGDIFLKITDFFKVYIDFVKNYQNSLSTLTELKKENAELRKFLKTQMKKCKGHVNETLESFLITPVQRIPRYNLLIKEIVKYTWPNHPDYEDLLAAMDKIKEIAHYVNEKAREAENLTKIYTIQSNITGKFDRDLIGPDRHLLKEGTLTEIYGLKKKTRPVFCILFNDILVCCKSEASKSGSIRRRKNSTTGRKDQMEFVSRIEFDNARMHSVKATATDENSFVFVIVSKGTELTLSASTKAERKEWTSLIAEQIALTNEKARFYEDKKDEVAKQKAAEARALISEKYTRNRVKGQGEEEESVIESPSGMRRFAQRKNVYSSLTPQQKLEYVEAARVTTDELLAEETAQKEAKEKESKERAEHFKTTATTRYRQRASTISSDPPTPETKLRKFASLRKGEQYSSDDSCTTTTSSRAPQKALPPIPNSPKSPDTSETKLRKFASLKKSLPPSENTTQSTEPSSPEPTKLRKFASLKRDSPYSSPKTRKSMIPESGSAPAFSYVNGETKDSSEPPQESKLRKFASLKKGSRSSAAPSIEGDYYRTSGKQSPRGDSSSDESSPRKRNSFLPSFKN